MGLSTEVRLWSHVYILFHWRISNFAAIARDPPKDGEFALQTPQTEFWRYG